MIDREIIAVFHYDDKGSKCCGREPYRYAEEIIRCKECKWQYVVTDDEEGTSYYMCGVWANATDEDVFCSYGEREGE